MFALALCVLAAACSRREPPRPPAEPVTLTVAAPQTSGLGAGRTVLELAQPYAIERLTAFDGQGRPAERIVDRWVSSDGYRTWRLSVRRGVRFQDGTPLATEDVRDAILASAKANEAVAVCLPDIESVSVEGERDVLVRLSQPCFFLLDDLDTAISRLGKDGTPVGTGPFRTVKESKDAVSMEANPLYYRGAPAIDRLELRAYATLRAPWAEMMRGRVDVLLDVGPDSAEFLRDQSTLELRPSPSLKVMAVALNLARPKFRSAEVRLALNLAIDRVELVQQGIKGQGVPADVPVWPSLWAFDSSAPGMPFDPDRARAMLARQKAPLAFTCMLPENFAMLERLALLVQRQLRAVGVDMKIDSLPPEAFMDRLGSGNFEAAFLDFLGGPYLAIFYRIYHSPNPHQRWNQFGFKDAAVDSALDDMKAAGGEDALRLAFARFVDAMRANPPAIFLVCPNRAQAISRRFEVPRGADVDAFRTVAMWRLREPGR